MATWKTYRVSDIVSEIEEEKYVLPVIQRELVWTEEKMELLFDSLLKGNSFGGINVIAEEKDSKPLFASRYFTKDGNQLDSHYKETLTQEQFFVIDGQQRLQTFYIGLKGTYHGKQLFFDLLSDYQNYYEFEFSNEIDSLSKSTKEDRPIKDCLWYPAKELFQNLKEFSDDLLVIEKIITRFNITDSNKIMYIRKNIHDFYVNIIASETIGVAKVNINKTIPEIENRQKIVELFRRLNEGGTELSAFDLIASTLKGFDYRMESFLRSMEEKYSEIGLSQENLIKLIFLLRDNHLKEMSSIDVSDAEFAIQNQKRIKNVLESVCIFLNNTKLYDYYKNANSSFIPLFFIAYHLFHKNSISDSNILTYWDNYETGNVDFKPMQTWIYYSLLNGVFRSRGAGWIPYKTGIKKIHSEIIKHKNNVFPCDELLNIYITHPLKYESNYTVDNLDNLDSQFIYYLIYGKRNIRVNDIDHIMPKSILIKLGFKESDINSIKNYQLLDFGTNRGEKNGKPFAVWVNNYVKDKQIYIKTHLIPANEKIWDEKVFMSFREERAKLIINKINEYLK